MSIINKILSAISETYKGENDRNEGKPYYLKSYFRTDFINGIFFFSALFLVWISYLGFNYVAKITAKPKTIRIHLSNPIENPSFKSDSQNKSFSLESSESKYKGIIFRCNLTSGQGFARTLNDELSCKLTNCNQLIKSLGDINNKLIPSIDFDFFIDKTTETCNF